MVANIKVSGSKTTCQEVAYTNGAMDEYIRDNIRTIRSTDTVFTHGLMSVSIVVIGTWENSMGSAPTLSKRKKN